MSARLQLHVLVERVANFALLESGAHLAVYLVLLLRHLDALATVGTVLEQRRQVGVDRVAVGIKVTVTV